MSHRTARQFCWLLGGALLALLQACATGMQVEQPAPSFKEALGQAYGAQQQDSYGRTLVCARSDYQPVLVQTGSSVQQPVLVQTSSVQRPVTAPSSSAANNSYQLQPITWDLIARLQQAAPDAMLGNRDLLTPSQAYRIGAGDVLAIVVWEHPELGMSTMGTDKNATPGYLVGDAGDIQFPYLGKFRVTGMTESEAYTAITRALGRIIRNPQVTLRVQDYRSQRVYIDGEVKTPGVYSVTDLPMSLPEALNRAGGALTNSDLSRLQLNRKGKQHLINMSALVAKGVNPNSILLQAGDMLRVPGRDESKVYIIGEVSKPLALPLQNGRMTLNAALGEAAGVSPITGNARQVYVIRTRADAANGAQPAVYHLDAKSPTALILAEQFELQPKDVVYVDASSLANWNRVISLILPSAALLKTSRDLGN